MHSADRSHPAIKSLRCCFYICPDVTIVRDPFTSSWFNTEAVYPHTCVWNCTEYRNETKKNRTRAVLGTLCNVVDEEEEEHSRDPFYGHFKRLPYEMQRHCLSFLPTFHMLVNPAFWIEQDRLHFSRIMTSDRHMIPHTDGRHLRFRYGCSIMSGYYLKMYDFNQTKGCVYFGTDNGLRMNLFPRNKRIDERFGDMNRYVSCYYRECTHFGKKKKTCSKKGATSCWEQLNRRLGTGRTLDNQRIEDFNRTGALNVVFEQYMYSPYYNPKRLRQAVKAALEPGVYYWEFINYNWEEVAAAADCGRENRQEHFFLHPPDAARHRFQKKRMRMSLMYRRVVHPSEEIDNRYTTLGYFETFEVDFKNTVYLVFDRDRFSPEAKMSQKMVYQHVLTPTFGVKVHEHRCACCSEVIYYSAVFPDNVELYSLDVNKTTVRWNFFVEVDDMDDEERTKFGASMVNVVRSGLDTGYAFVPHNVEVTLDAVDVFNFFFL